jgi:hypothetical protein
VANVGWGDGVFAGETIDERIKSWGGGRRWAVGARGSRADGYGGNGLMSACVRRRGDATGGVGPAARGSKCAKNLGVFHRGFQSFLCGLELRPCLVVMQIQNIFSFTHHIESLNACMKH